MIDYSELSKKFNKKTEQKKKRKIMGYTTPPETISKILNC